MRHDHSLKITNTLQPWNKGRLVGQKRPLKPRDVWAIRVRLELSGSKRDLALFDLAIDSKLRACDLVCLKIRDVRIGERTRERATIVQKKTGRPVQFEIADATRRALDDWIHQIGEDRDKYLFPSRV
jgi:integrase